MYGFRLVAAALGSISALSVHGLKYDAEYEQWNLNTNQTATDVLDYWGEWEGHTYHPSPDNWRFPFYTLFLDRFVNGDPSNDDANGTVFEQEVSGTQLRFGGDVQGLADSLDYIQDLGIKGLYIAGSPFINQPWAADSYSPLDHTLLDWHFGNITVWRNAIDEIHSRGMYVILDNTVATLGDLIGFEGYLNGSAPFTPEHEHRALWKTSRRYHDFSFGTEYNETCHQLPRFWLEDGHQVTQDVYDSFKGCYDGDFDQYGDTEAFGVYMDYRRQTTKFASVQDRLREWVPSVRQRIQHLSCITIAMLDIDGFRFDKATQVTADAEGAFSAHLRSCAQRLNKTNFFLPGEITGGNAFGSVYIGRGREPDMYLDSIQTAVNLTQASLATGNFSFIRAPGNNALDAAAFHYSVYRSLLRFLGMDGGIEASNDTPLNWVDAWNVMLTTNDLINPSTGQFDPRHMYGASNQDVFRWPAIKLGVERNLLGLFITTLHMPGIPLLLWGEEQAFHILDNTASNYMFGRMPISGGPAWQMHGCYSLPATLYYDMPLEATKTGCEDDTVTYDHRDPSHPVHNIIKHMYFLRERYPVLADGFHLQQLSNHTVYLQYPGSSGTPTETGLWSTLRSGSFGSQEQMQPVWLLYHNRNTTTTYTFDCSKTDGSALVAPFGAGTKVRNLMFPHRTMDLQESQTSLGINGSTERNGCYPDITLDPFEFQVYVPEHQFVPPPAMLTRFTPGHDFRLQSTAPSTPLNVSFEASVAMDCDAFTKAVTITSITETGSLAQVDATTVKCTQLSGPSAYRAPYVGAIASAWSWSATVVGLGPGIHQIAVLNATTADGKSHTNARDRFLLRVGGSDNPLVFPSSGNYSDTLLRRDGTTKELSLAHSAPGASWFRYTTNWESSWSAWMPYTGGTTAIKRLPWSGTPAQAWDGDHVMVQYHSRLLGSSSYTQSSDAGTSPWSSAMPRRFPHLFASGPFNQYGFDAGLPSAFSYSHTDVQWQWHFMDEWPSHVQLSVWGINPDGQPDQTFVYGDIDHDGVLDRSPPSSLVESAVNITAPPGLPYLAYQMVVDDGNLRYGLLPRGNMYVQMVVYMLLWLAPVLGGLVTIWAFRHGFYRIKLNRFGVKVKDNSWSSKLTQALAAVGIARQGTVAERRMGTDIPTIMMVAAAPLTPVVGSTAAATAAGARRRILIATMEYNIDDWGVKIKIGGLGVMAQLMGTALRDRADLVWVVPCVGGIDYPIDTRAEPMYVQIMEDEYEIQVQYHVLENVTFVLLDAPVFRKQSKAVPYPGRMDDLESAVYYSAWNQCIAQTADRFSVDLYHINDYHGAAAPLYLLPRTIPTALSLHNAEFQGMWPMRTPEEREEVCSVYNLPSAVVEKYVQFGSVFNLLHAGASYLRIHQQGFGAVGVSKKYGDRSFARYPIFWGLSKIGQLPNPDPTDTAEWNKEDALARREAVTVDEQFEANRPALKRQAQEWAGLKQDPDADLFVFVGRWSLQKGVDLIADIFPWVLDHYATAQLICVGPVIDLYGKFAALKLERLMEIYPGRVYSKPEFTQLPPYIFSGAEFALIPSRDEPFGLVAVEFGRKGALGVGARVGGLGQMPGWWFTVESTKANHLLHQFKGAIVAALDTDRQTRAVMRAWSAKQRFPVAEWLEKLEKLYSGAIKVHGKVANSKTRMPAAIRAGLDRIKQLKKVGKKKAPADEEGHPLSLAGLGIELQRRPAWMSRMPPLDGYGDGHGSPCSLDPTPSPSRPGSLYGHETETPSLGPSPINTRPSSPTRFSDSLLDVPLPAPPNVLGGFQHRRNTSLLSLEGVVNHSRSSSIGRPASIDSPRSPKTFKLQQVDPFFTDSTGDFEALFKSQLDRLSAKTSTAELCIEDFLVKSEKEWFDSYRHAKLGVSSHSRGREPSKSPGRSPNVSRSQSRRRLSKNPPPGHRRAGSHLHLSVDLGTEAERRGRTSRRPSTSPAPAPAPAPAAARARSDSDGSPERDPRDAEALQKQFGLDADYVPPTGLKKYLQYRIGEWPVYAMLLAINQIIASNSYQITLLTGEVGQTATKLYVVASIYLVSTIFWYTLSRTMKLLYCLSLPFAVYGLAFVTLGLSPFAPSAAAIGWVQDVATGLYAFASSSGSSLSFAYNFGTDGGSPHHVWIQRLAVIQGIAQLYTLGLWGWGHVISTASANSMPVSTVTLAGSRWILALCGPVALVLWTIGIVLLLGLPDFYRESPGPVPQLWLTLFRRRTIAWYLLAMVLQNYFLSTLIGRTWSFLFSSKAVPVWAVVLLAVGFLGFAWVAILYVLARAGESHPWLFPLFSVGLGAPRWAQIWWGCSRFGLWLPWVAGGAAGGALASRALWLWLGLLDSVQGAGVGMILMLTLTRVHVAAAVVAAQVLGSIATMAARATAPDKVGPGDVFPDLSEGVAVALSKPWFWVVLGLQLMICFGYFKFFRKEQVSKP